MIWRSNGRLVALTLVLLLQVAVASEAMAIDPIVGQPPIGDFPAAHDLHIQQGERDGAPPPKANGNQFVEPRDPRAPHHSHWYLGVFGHYTTTGHLLTKVFPNTPASRAGLEPGDRIVTVNGHQVGDVIRTQIPIDLLLQRHATRDGLVRLLVQDRRSSRLVNLDVRLTRGRVHY